LPRSDKTIATKAIDKGTSATEVMRMFHASAVPDLAEPRKRTLLITGRPGAGLFAMTAYSSHAFLALFRIL
jgi:hypothetical protein